MSTQVILRMCLTTQTHIQKGLPGVRTPVEARLHVVSVHCTRGTPYKPIVATLAHPHSCHWRLGLLFRLWVLVCLALLGLGGLEHMLPQSEVLEAPGVGC